MRDVLRYGSPAPAEPSPRPGNYVTVPDLVGKDAAARGLLRTWVGGREEGPDESITNSSRRQSAQVRLSYCTLMKSVAAQVPSLYLRWWASASPRLELRLEAGLTVSAGSGFCVSQEPAAGSLVSQAPAW